MKILLEKKFRFKVFIHVSSNEIDVVTPCFHDDDTTMLFLTFSIYQPIISSILFLHGLTFSSCITSDLCVQGACDSSTHDMCYIEWLQPEKPYPTSLFASVIPVTP